MSLLPSQQAQYSALIDDILAAGDLQTISASAVRKQLQAKLGVDVLDNKDAVKALILARFDHVSAAEAAPGSPSPSLLVSKSEPNGATPKPKIIKKERSESTTTEDDNDQAPPKKKRKQNEVKEESSANADADAKLAAQLQAEENRSGRSRATRGGGVKPKKTVKKRAPKKKSASTVKAEDDSEIEVGSDGEIKEKPKKGGFNKPYDLSAPLADLVGAPTLSRPQVVKKIWRYIKEKELQIPTDKRQIRCDEKMQTVFKSDTVHMFTMNKILGKHLYDIEE
ncbi:hypothetical protein BJ878DRAFT_538466 [Calycina marina]|uniref:DM2 domain-containing protein n=1 Tax=Calycina marina TaxID=1763456 RepID=A0A9P7ZAW0_9HELO|nr:hypothetical protein BJ878DRAFT_538466 [Calycina marina]